MEAEVEISGRCGPGAAVLPVQPKRLHAQAACGWCDVGSGAGAEVCSLKPGEKRCLAASRNRRRRW
jgi:hypothetical protein